MDLSSKWALLDPSYRLRLILKPTLKRLRALQSVLFSSISAIQQTFLFATRINVLSLHHAASLQSPIFRAFINESLEWFRLSHSSDFQQI